MKTKLTLWIVAVLALAGVCIAATNLTINVVLSDVQYTNLQAVAAARGLTPAQFLSLTNLGIAQELRREAEALQFQLLSTRWQSATEEQRQAALEALSR